MATKEERAQLLTKKADVLAFLTEQAQAEQLKLMGKKSASVTTAATRERLFHMEFEKTLERLMKNKIVIPKPTLKLKKAPVKRILNLLLSDLHFGAELDPREVPVGFGAVEEARRIASVVRQAAEWKPQYRNETQLIVHLAGDIIAGKLHDVQSAAPMSRQMGAALHLLLQALGFLSHAFPQGVKVLCTPGNHDRRTERHPERATDGRWDSYETDLAFALKKAFQFAGVKHVNFEIPMTPFYTWRSFDKRGFGCHGDTILKVGYPGTSINVANARKQINEINGNLEGSERYSMFVSGHVHTCSLTTLPNNVELMTNGCLIPPDAFANSIGILHGTCAQYLWESVPGFICGDSRKLKVDVNTDKDASLDKIVKPFTDF